MSIKNSNSGHASYPNHTNLDARKGNLKLLLQLRFTFDTERDLQGIVDILTDEETLQEVLDILK